MTHSADIFFHFLSYHTEPEGSNEIEISDLLTGKHGHCQTRCKDSELFHTQAFEWLYSPFHSQGTPVTRDTVERASAKIQSQSMLNLPMEGGGTLSMMGF